MNNASNTAESVSCISIVLARLADMECRRSAVILCFILLLGLSRTPDISAAEGKLPVECEYTSQHTKLLGCNYSYMA